MKRKTFWAIVSCVVAFVISVGATYAWLVDSDSAAVTTTLILGENDIELLEIFEPPVELQPGMTFRKEPVVYNTANWPTFVRARVEFSNLEGYSISRLYTDGVAGINTDHWYACDCGCGYFYYMHVLHPSEFDLSWLVTPPDPWEGGPTAPLFTHVHILDQRDGTPLQLVDMVDFDIIIYVESRNHIDNPPCDVGFVADAPCACPNMWREIWNS